jgi:hypothetical protein
MFCDLVFCAQWKIGGKKVIAPITGQDTLNKRSSRSVLLSQSGLYITLIYSLELCLFLIHTSYIYLYIL